MIQHLGRYQILRELGRGGMGVVYKALDPNLERHVAIKCLNEELSRDELVVARFLREARNVAALTHPNCVRLYVVDEHEGMPYFVMEYVDGQSLAEYIARHGRCAPDMALRIVRQCAEALAAADAKNIVHRDVKPGNVMLDSSGRALLADFGIACVQYGSNTGGSPTIMGTPGYMPPELIERGTSDRRGDIFALGAVYYEMLTGQRLVPGNELGSARSEMRQPGFPDLAAIEAEFGSETAALLGRMLAPEPEARFSDYAELLQALDPDQAALNRRAAETAPTMQVSTLGDAAGAAALAPTLAATEAATAQVESAAGSPTRAMPAPGMARYRKAGVAALLLAGITLIGLAIALTGGNDSDPALLADDAAQGAPEAATSASEGIAAEPKALELGSDAGAALAAQAPQPETDADSGSPTASDSPSPQNSEPAVAEFSLATPDGAGDPALDSSEVKSDAAESAPAVAAAMDATETATAVAGPGSGGFEIQLSSPETRSIDEASTAETGAEAIAQTSAQTSAQTIAPTSAQTITETGADPVAQVSVDAPQIELAAVDARIAETPTAVAETRPDRTPPRAAAAPRRAAAPAATRIAVVAVGDPAIAGPMAGEVESALRRDGRPVADRRFIAGFDQYLYEDGLDLAGLADPAAEAGVRYVVMVRAVPTGSRELYYYGRYDTAWGVQVDAVTYDLLRADQIGSSSVEQLEYTGLNAGQKARDAVGPWLEPISRQFGR